MEIKVFNMVTMCPAVYTRNRNFRLLRSSKLGKTAWLTVAKESKYQVGVTLHGLRKYLMHVTDMMIYVELQCSGPPTTKMESYVQPSHGLSGVQCTVSCSILHESSQVDMS